MLPAAAPTKSGSREFVVSPEFTSKEREALERAASRWNSFATEKFYLRSAKDGEWAEDSKHGIYRIPYLGDHWKRLSKNEHGQNVVGSYVRFNDQITIVDGLDIDFFELVAMHELGHAHGLDHAPAPAVMHAVAGTSNNFTSNDLAECQHVGACE